MLALFDCWLPGPRGKDLPPQFRLVLAGDTPDDVAWSLVELFQEAMTRPPESPDPDRHAPYPSIPSEALNRSLSQTLALQEARFSPDWWRRQEWQFIDALSRGSLGKMQIADFRKMFPPQALLSLHLTQLVGTYFVPTFGPPAGPLDARGAIAYFERHRCLKWISPTDLAAWAALPSS